jgi:HSP20 family protein
MKIVNRNTGWLPSIFDELLVENRLDVSNYENFSTPKVNISENFTNFVIALAVPGHRKEDFQIEVENKTLKVSVNSATKEQTEENTKYTLKEFNTTNFSRRFKLPKTVNTEDINASYNNGILEVSLPKLEEEKQLKRMVEIS